MGFGSSRFPGTGNGSFPIFRLLKHPRLMRIVPAHGIRSRSFFLKILKKSPKFPPKNPGGCGKIPAGSAFPAGPIPAPGFSLESDPSAPLRDLSGLHGNSCPSLIAHSPSAGNPGSQEKSGNGIQEGVPRSQSHFIHRNNQDFIPGFSRERWDRQIGIIWISFNSYS